MLKELCSFNFSKIFIIWLEILYKIYFARPASYRNIHVLRMSCKHLSSYSGTCRILFLLCRIEIQNGMKTIRYNRNIVIKAWVIKFQIAIIVEHQLHKAFLSVLTEQGGGSWERLHIQLPPLQLPLFKHNLDSSSILGTLQVKWWNASIPVNTHIKKKEEEDG